MGRRIIDRKQAIVLAAKKTGINPEEGADVVNYIEAIVKESLRSKPIPEIHINGFMRFKPNPNYIIQSLAHKYVRLINGMLGRDKKNYNMDQFEKDFEKFMNAYLGVRQKQRSMRHGQKKYYTKLFSKHL